MKYAILGTGAISAILFIYSIYTFFSQPTMFKTVAYGFLGTAVLFFLLIIIRKLIEDRELRRRTKNDME